MLIRQHRVARLPQHCYHNLQSTGASCVLLTFCRRDAMPARRYVIVAPDSHHAMFWSSPDTAKDRWTADWFHVQVTAAALPPFPGVPLLWFGVSAWFRQQAEVASRPFTNYRAVSPSISPSFVRRVAAGAPSLDCCVRG